VNEENQSSIKSIVLITAKATTIFDPDCITTSNSNQIRLKKDNDGSFSSRAQFISLQLF